MDSDIKYLIQALELSPIEAKIFNELLFSKGLKVGALSKRLGLHRGTTYNALQRLIHKGIVSFGILDGVLVYQCNPASFNELLLRQVDQLEHQRRAVKKIEKFIHSNQKISEPETPISWSYGRPAARNAIIEVIQYCKSTGEKYLHISQGGQTQRHLGEEFYKRSQTIKVNGKVDCKAILSGKTKSDPFEKNIRASKIRWTKDTIPNSTITSYGKNIRIIDWQSKPFLVINIKNSALAKSHRWQFHALWKAAQGPEELYS